jgi:5'(3')-deoxyribonucleotidase
MKFHSLKDIDNKVPKPGSFKHFLRIQEHGGRVVKGVNTTADVGVDAIKKQAAKFGNKVDKDGRPPTLSKKVKGSKTNVLFNLGLAESDRQNNLVDFVDFCKEQLDLESIPTIKFVSDTENTTFGYFDNDTKGIVIQNDGRHQMDVMRTVAHELVHYKQDQTFNRELNGEDGSSDENQANSLAGVILRRWGQKNPSLFTESVDNTDESVLYYAKMAENLGEIASASKVYVDMDGVLADFFGEWQKLIGSDWRKVKDIEPALQKIRDKDNFWLDLPLLPQAKNLLGVIKKVKGSYTILSSPLPNDPNSEPHKREWIKKNLSFFPPENVIITHDKPKYAVNSDGTPNILIDDFGKNIASWEAAGGEGFKHKDHKFERTAKAIKQHMTEPAQEADMYSTATKMAKESLLWSIETGKDLNESIDKIIQILEEMDRRQFMKTAGKVGAGLGAAAIASSLPKFAMADNKLIVKADNGKVYDISKFPGTLQEKVKSFKEAIAKIYAKSNADVPSFKFYLNDKFLGSMNNTGNIYKKVPGEEDLDALAKRMRKESIEENFADGKKKGKSRPGRVKKSGASCSSSVTELRKKAKNASGERAKMYHWCANMKSGKKK